MSSSGNLSSLLIWKTLTMRLVMSPFSSKLTRRPAASCTLAVWIASRTVVAVDRLAGGGDALDRVEDDQRGVVGGDRVIVRRTVELGRSASTNGATSGFSSTCGAAIVAYQPSAAGKPAPLSSSALMHAVAAAFDRSSA